MSQYTFDVKGLFWAHRKHLISVNNNDNNDNNGGDDGGYNDGSGDDFLSRDIFDKTLRKNTLCREESRQKALDNL